MVKAETLFKGQKLRVNLEKVQDRLSKNVIKQLTKEPYGKLIGFKMVDGNSFGLVLELSDSSTSWFFEEELSELNEEEANFPSKI